jgi:hypothetical protein
MESQAPETPTLWTATFDYFATGEGRTMFAWIGYAVDETECRNKCEKVFDPFFVAGFECVRGLARNDITQLLWSEKALDVMKNAEARANLVAYSTLHFNYS